MQFRDFEKRRNVQYINDFECPACYPHPHSLHVDSNMKLYVWDRHKELWRTSYYDGAFIIPDAHVEAHLQYLDLAMDNRRHATSQVQMQS